MSDTDNQPEYTKLSKREQIEKAINKLAAFCTAKIPQKTIDLYIDEFDMRIKNAGILTKIISEYIQNRQAPYKMPTIKEILNLFYVYITPKKDVSTNCTKCKGGLISCLKFDGEKNIPYKVCCDCERGQYQYKINHGKIQYISADDVLEYDPEIQLLHKYALKQFGFPEANLKPAPFYVIYAHDAKALSPAELISENKKELAKAQEFLISQDFLRLCDERKQQYYEEAERLEKYLNQIEQGGNTL
ncbi:hypothetical protein NO1_0252 [Candidatus Termititenax aidoneus]|uniref:Uncharacterized protein n=1 Tax=Termititenax aidoneus TaxID=2218524 RepID=A0A388T972_TERA1|nr:hypothetical protein NO1_0252 [Candidatus Termititenax aidoneus]